MELRRGFARDWLPLLLLILAVFAYLSFAQDLFSDGDTSWHLAAGQLILETGTVPRTDPFSFTFRGDGWIAHEWLAEVLMAASFLLAGTAGLGLVTALAVTLVLLITGAELRRWLEPRHVVAGLALLFIVLTPSILARPHVLAWPLLACWTLIMLRARERGARPPFAAAGLMLVWANLHGSFLFGFFLAGFFALEALVEEHEKRKVLLGWGAFAGLSLIASIVTPAGIEGLVFPLQVSSMKALSLIEEWRPSSPVRDPLFFAMLAGLLVLLALRWRAVPRLRILLLAGLVYLALAHARHQAVFAIVTVLLLAQPLAGERPRNQDLRPWGALQYGLLALLLLVIGGVRLATPIPWKDSGTNPRAAIAAVPPELRNEPVFNSYGFGGPLILSGVAPFIDGRADMYGDSFTFQARAIEDGDQATFRAVVRKWNIRWTILYPKTPLVAVLDRDPDWERLYADKWAVIHVSREGGE